MGINETIVHAVLHDFAYAHSDQNKARFAKATSGMHIATELAKAPHGATMAKKQKKTSRAGREFGGAHAATELRAAQDAHGQRPNPRNVRRVNVSLEQIQDDGLWKS